MYNYNISLKMLKKLILFSYSLFLLYSKTCSTNSKNLYLDKNLKFTKLKNKYINGKK